MNDKPFPPVLRVVYGSRDSALAKGLALGKKLRVLGEALTMIPKFKDLEKCPKPLLTLLK